MSKAVLGSRKNLALVVRRRLRINRPSRSTKAQPEWPELNMMKMRGKLELEVLKVSN